MARSRDQLNCIKMTTESSIKRAGHPQKVEEGLVAPWDGARHGCQPHDEAYSDTLALSNPFLGFFVPHSLYYINNNINHFIIFINIYSMLWCRLQQMSTRLNKRVSSHALSPCLVNNVNDCSFYMSSNCDYKVKLVNR